MELLLQKRQEIETCLGIFNAYFKRDIWIHDIECGVRYIKDPWKRRPRTTKTEVGQLFVCHVSDASEDGCI